MNSQQQYENISRAATNTANVIGGAFQRYHDRTAIDDILEQANSKGDEAAVDVAIGQILQRVSPERQPQAMQILQQKKAVIAQKKERALQEEQAKALGLPVAAAGAHQTVQAQYLKNKVEQDKITAANQRYQDIVGDSPFKQPNGPAGAEFNAQPQQTQVQPPLLPGMKGNQPQGQSGKGIASLSDDQLIALSGVPGYSEPAKQELKRRQEDRKLSQKEKEIKIKRNEDVSLDVVKNANKTAETLAQRRSALELSKNAIINKDLSFWTGDNLAELTGIEGFRSTEGAIFKTAGKEYFLGSIGRAGIRPNQWVEQQIADMLTKIGRSTEANLSVTRALENELDLDQAKVDITNRLANDLEEKLGYIPRDLGARVQKELSSYAEDKQKELYNDLRAIKSIGEKKIMSFGKVKEGTPVSKTVAKALLIKNKNDPKKAADEAKQLGYTF